MSARPRLLSALIVSVLGSATPVRAEPAGTLAIGVHVTLVNRWFEPAEAEGLVTPFAVCDP